MSLDKIKNNIVRIIGLACDMVLDIIGFILRLLLQSTNKALTIIITVAIVIGLLILFAPGILNIITRFI